MGGGGTGQNVPPGEAHLRQPGLLNAEAAALATGVKQRRKIQEAQIILRPHGSLELACGLGVWLGLCAVKRREKGTPSGGNSSGNNSGKRMGCARG